MPLAGAVAINFSAPLFATLLAALWLKEKVGLARGAALVIGFVGVLLVAAPGADSFRIGALFALGNAVLLGSVHRRGARHDDDGVGRNADDVSDADPDGRVRARPAVLRLRLAAQRDGLDRAAGQRRVQRAGSILVDALAGAAPTSAVGPFYYFSLVWAIAIGFFFWGDIPTLALLAGSAIVVASGLFCCARERQEDTANLRRRTTARLRIKER